MAKPYSRDLRERAMRRVAAGERARSVATVLKGSVSSVIKWAPRLRRTGSVAPGKMGGHRSLRVSGEHRTWLLVRVAGDPNVTLRGLARELGERGITVCHGTVGRFRRREDQSCKKNRFSGGTTAAKARASPRPMEGPSRQGGSKPSGLPRRDRDQNQHGAAAWLGSPPQAAHRPCAAWPLEDDDLPGRAAR